MKTTMTYGFALALTCSLTATLKAQNIYVSNGGNGTVGEYTMSGAPVNASLISGLATGEPMGIAVISVPEPSTFLVMDLGGVLLVVLSPRYRTR